MPTERRKRREATPYRALRVRVTVVSAAVVLVVLAATAVAVTAVHRRVLVENLEESLGQAAAELAGRVAAGTDLPAVAGFGDDDAAFQVVSPAGTVVASSANIDGAGPLVAAPDTGGTVARRVDGLPHDGEEFLVLSTVVDGGDADGSVVLVAATLDDIDDSTTALRGALVLAVPAATAVLGVAVWVLAGRLLRDAEAAAVRQERFVADASHELRNPLTRIRTELEVDLAHPDRADPLATHRLVLDEATGLQRLVDDLLQLARTDAGTRPAPPVTVDLDAVVARVAADLRASRPLAIDTSAVGAVQVTGHADQLGRLVGNLADNAARHAASSVRFELAAADGDAVLAVTDDGPGIPPADRERVFERFARLDEARGTRSGGTGLGLAIAREIVTAHGGTIAVDPDHRPGARLVVTLPSA